METVIFASPLLLTLYGVALLICIFDLVKRDSGYFFPILSAALFVGTTVYACLLGAGYAEVSIVTLVFLALNLTVYFMHREGK